MVEDDAMQQSREVNVNWLRINVPSVASIVVVGVGLTLYISDLKARIEAVEDYRVTRSTVTDKNFEQIQNQLQPLANLPYRVGILEQGLLATNQRVDQYLQMLGSKIDGVADRVNGLSTKVEVLSQKIDALSPPPKRAELGGALTR